MTRRAYIGLGSNVGDRLENLRRALDAIGDLDDTHVDVVSVAVESEPWGVTEQPPFANAVAAIVTGIATDRLLVALKDVEAALGRRPGVRYGPRVIDLDILLVGDEEWERDDLVVPHPRLLERDFAVTPLLEIAPDALLPDGSPVTADAATEGRITGSLGPIPGYEDLTPVSGGEGEAVGADEPVPPAGRIADGWESVAESLSTAGRGTAYVAELLFAAAVVEDEGIPIAWDPMPPGEVYNPWGMPRLYRLLVPVAFAGQARRALDEARRAARPAGISDWAGTGEEE